VADLTSYKDRLLNENEEKSRYVLNLQRDNNDLKENLSNTSIGKSVAEGKGAELQQSYERLMDERRMMEDQ